MSAKLLVQTLRGFENELAGLRAVLTPAADRLFVYYICPLTNLKRMVVTGILPNATAPRERTDLSGQSVQAKRDVQVLLDGGKRVEAHQCINLFWNPLNWTMRAFQHNGLLREAASKNPDDAIVCVLEIDLETLLGGRCQWTIAPQNLAGTGFASFSNDFFTGVLVRDDGTPGCDWKTIFSVGPNTERLVNRKRSAELIVHLGEDADGESSLALPFEMVTRIIVPTDQIRALTHDQTAFLNSTGKPICRLSSVNGTPVFFPRDELLKAEKGFLRSLTGRAKSDSDVLAKLNAALSALEKFEIDHPELCPVRERFVKPKLADDHHGSIHATRVMFWSAFLVQHLNEALKQELLPMVLTAASLHDTCREDSQEDEAHGRLAVEAHRGIIAAFLKDERLLTPCLNAIQYHCVPDEKYPAADLTLQILKDADALDRGRFAPLNQEGGCETKFFRTEVLKRDTYKNIAWMAYWAAQITRYSPFGSKPCADFGSSLCSAVNSLSEKPSG
ncbi:MAG: HD domain-containing protein [Verrucomicrobiia bacterium]